LNDAKRALQFIRDTGSFTSASELIRAGLRLLEERGNKIEALRMAIIEGKESGIAENYDPKQHLEELHKKFKV